MTTRIFSTWLTSRVWMAVTCCALACALLVGTHAFTAHAATLPAHPGQATQSIQETSSPAKHVPAQAVVSVRPLVLPSIYWRDGQDAEYAPEQRKQLVQTPTLQPLSWCGGVLKGKFC